MGAPPQGLHGPSFQGQPLPTGGHLAQCRPSSSLACPASPVQGGSASCQATPSGRGLGSGPSIPALDPPLQRRPEDPNCLPQEHIHPRKQPPRVRGGCGEAQGLFSMGRRRKRPSLDWGRGVGGQLGAWRGREQPLAPSGFSQMPSHGEPEPHQPPPRVSHARTLRAPQPWPRAPLRFRGLAPHRLRA